MAVTIVSKIRVQTNTVSFDIELKAPIVSVYGDSATGKTFLIHVLKTLSLNKELDFKVSSIGYQELSLGEPHTLLKGIKNSLIIIDNADTILKDTDRYKKLFLEDKSNQYLLYTRNGFRYGVGLKDRAYFDCTGNRIVTQYPARGIQEKGR